MVVLLHVVEGVQKDGRHMVVNERVHGFLPVLTRRYEMRASQHLEVMGDQRLLDADDLRQFSNRCLTISEAIDNPCPNRIRQGGEQPNDGPNSPDSTFLLMSTTVYQEICIYNYFDGYHSHLHLGGTARFGT